MNRQKSILGAYDELIRRNEARAPGELSLRNPRWGERGSPVSPRVLEDWRTQARSTVSGLLARPFLPPAPEVRLEERLRYDGLEIERLSWETGYGPPTRALFLKPQGSTARLPGVLALHDHGGNKYFGARKITCTSTQTHPDMRRHQQQYYGGAAWANELARRGYGVLVPDAFLFASRRVHPADLPARALASIVRKAGEPTGEVKPEAWEVDERESSASIERYNRFAAAYEHLAAKALFSAGTTWPGVFLADDQFALDYLCSREEIDSRRIGCCGLSGGGLRTDYLAGMDDRIRCSVTVGFMTSWSDFARTVCFTHTWMVYLPLLPRLMEFPEILAMRAPLPALVLQTTEDPLYSLEEAKRCEQILTDCYQRAGAPQGFRMSYHSGPHKFDLPMQEEAFSWLDRWLKG